MSKWILVAMLAAAPLACERDRGTEETGGEVGAERREVERDVEKGAEKTEREGRSAAEEIGEGAEDVGRGVREGAEDVGQDVEREWKERTQGTEGPTAQDQRGEKNRELVQKVRQRLMAADLSFVAQNVQVIAENGTVTLRGNVSSAEERDEVGRIARGTTGVQQVNNRLEIGFR